MHLTQVLFQNVYCEILKANNIWRFGAPILRPNYYTRLLGKFEIGDPELKL